MTCKLLAAGAALALAALATPAQAATINLTCQLTSTEDNELYNNNAYLRLNGYSQVTEIYRIDDVAKTVTLVSRSGVRYAPPENGGGATPVNDPMQFYQDVRSLTPDQVVFCTDADHECRQWTLDQGTMESRVTVGLTVIDLASNRISFQRDQISSRKDNSGYLRIGTKWAGTCTRG